MVGHKRGPDPVSSLGERLKHVAGKILSSPAEHTKLRMDDENIHG